MSKNALLHAKNPNAVWSEAQCDDDNRLLVSSVSSIDGFPTANLGAFGDLQTVEMVPLLNLSFATGLRDQLITATTANSATVDTDAARLRIQSGTNAAGSAIAQSYRPVAYRAGQGITAKFTALFTAGVAQSTQIAGMGSSTDGYFFGYNGTQFGVLHRVRSVDTWVAQTAWNGDKCDGTGSSGFDWNPAYGTPLKIVYPYLGYGTIRFYVLNPVTSAWILCHTIQYPNSTAATQLSNPTLSFYAQSVNSGATTNQIVHIGSVGVFLDGIRSFLGPQFGIDSGKASITTETNLLTLRSATTVNGATNRGLARVRQISFLTDANTGYATFRIKRNVTLGGTPAYTPISGSTANNGVTLTSAQSILSADTAGTTVTGGTMIWNALAFFDSSGVVDLTMQDIFIGPGETLTFSGTATTTATLAIAVNWSEDVQ